MAEKTKKTKDDRPIEENRESFIDFFYRVVTNSREETKRWNEKMKQEGKLNESPKNKTRGPRIRFRCRSCNYPWLS